VLASLAALETAEGAPAGSLRLVHRLDTPVGGLLCLARTLDAAEPAVLDAPTEAARTLLAAHRAHVARLPEFLADLRVEGIGSDRTLVLRFAGDWHADDSPTVRGAGLALTPATARCAGETRLALRVARGVREGTLRLQPCDSSRCLAPVDIRFSI